MNQFFRVLVIAIICLYVAAASVPFLDQSTFWFISVSGLIFPWLFFTVVATLIYLAFQRSKWSLLVFGLLLLSWKSVVSTFTFRYLKPGRSTDQVKTSFKVLSWNVSRWDQMKSPDQLATSKREQMLNEIFHENADILSFHEFFEPSEGGLKYYRSNIDAIRAKGYPYYIFFPTSAIHNRTKKFGMAIFSRHPIIDSATYDFGNTPHSEGLIFADIKFGDKIIRVYTTHLESFKMGRSGSSAAEHTGLIAKAKASIRSIRSAYGKRDKQLEFVKNKIRLSPYPLVLLGNLGDVPNSRTYRVLQEDLNDAFIGFGSGFGATYPNILPNLRLDYILVDKKIGVNNFRVSKTLQSDHFPIIADLSLAL